MKHCSLSGDGAIHEADMHARAAEDGQEVTDCQGGGCGPAVEFSASIRSCEGEEVFRVRAQYEDVPDALDSFAALDHLVWQVRRFQDNS